MSTLEERWFAHIRIQHPELDEAAAMRVAREAARTLKDPPTAPFPITAETLSKQAEEAFDLSYLQQLQLWLGWRVIRRKADTIMNGNHTLTALGFIAAALNYSLVMLQNGTPIPQNGRDWIMFGLSASIAALGALAKASTVGSQPGDPPTPQRIAAEVAKGHDVDPVAAVKSVEATKVAVEVAAVADPSLRASG